MPATAPPNAQTLYEHFARAQQRLAGSRVAIAEMPERERREFFGLQLLAEDLVLADVESLESIIQSMADKGPA